MLVMPAAGATRRQGRANGAHDVSSHGDLHTRTVQLMLMMRAYSCPQEEECATDAGDAGCRCDLQANAVRMMLVMSCVVLRRSPHNHGAADADDARQLQEEECAADAGDAGWPCEL